MILAGDIGGTHARLALATRTAASGVELHRSAVLRSGPDSSLRALLAEFMAGGDEVPVAARLGLPGPVMGDVVRTTNLPWVVNRADLEAHLEIPVSLLNDLEAAAHGVATVAPERLVTLKAGASVDATRAVIAPGTGLGQALIVRDGERWIPVASEGGHTDFGPRDAIDAALLAELQVAFGHVSYERIVSGPGLVSLARFHAARLDLPDAAPARTGDTPQIAAAAADGLCEASRAAVDHWWRVLAAEAGNLALKCVARGGIYVAGGMAPRLIELFDESAFAQAFEAKGRYRDLMRSIPVYLVTDPWLAVRGAAVSERRDQET